MHLFTWIPAGNFQLNAGLLLDPLSLTFVLLVTFVGSLIHVYSVAYMEHDHDRRRFFAYLNLFVAAMLLLVLADSYLLLYVGWEGVGLASYLLIGFWNYRPDYATAANKAFVVNRVGDLGLSIAIMIMFAGFGSVDVLGRAAATRARPPQGLLTAIGLMLLLGACGKSAQFPLQSWLGDAMAGPTPVSALIHAATMVTAGRLPRRPVGAHLRGGAHRRARRRRSSARSPCCSGRSSAAPRTTSRRRSRPRRCPRSAT